MVHAPDSCVRDEACASLGHSRERVVADVEEDRQVCMVVIYHVFCLINYAGFMLFETQKPEQDRSDKS